jgi:hypothetical protein
MLIAILSTLALVATVGAILAAYLWYLTPNPHDFLD